MSETTTEALSRLERSLARERAFRREAEALLEGLALISGWTGSPLALFSELAERLREFVGYDQAALLLETRTRGLVRLAATDDRLPRIWHAGATFRRVLRGAVVIAYDTGILPEWAESDTAGSALLLPFAVAGRRGIVLLASGQRAFFHRSHERLAARFTPLVERALLQLELRRSQRAQARLAELGADLTARVGSLERATSRLGVGVLVFRGPTLVHASATAEKLLAPAGGARRVARSLRSALDANEMSGRVTFEGDAGPLIYDLEGLEDEATTLVLVRDVSAKARDRRERTALRERLHVLIQSLDSAVLVETEGREVALTNRAFCDFFGLESTPEGLTGANSEATLRGLAPLFCNASTFEARVRQLVDQRERVTGEPLHLWDGRTFERDFVPIIADGNYLGHLWQFRDISARERARDDLQRAREAALAASDAKSRFLAMMSHDMRTPLNAILGVAELVRDDVDEAIGSQVDIIRRNGVTLLGLIEDLLDLTRVEAGVLRLDPEPTDVLGTIRYAALLHAEAARRKGIRLTLELPDVLPTMLLDEKRLQQVVTNLVGNAVKFTEEGQVSVHLGARPAGGSEWTLELAVVDQGIGMSPEVLARIFEPFRQASDETRRRYGGAGLGLAITDALVHAMQGSIDVASSLGEGTRFLVRVPTRAVKRRTERPVPEVLRLDPSLSVLIVEDDPDSRHYALSVLSRAGAQVASVSDGSEVEPAVAARAFDVILMDLDMKQMGGIEAARRLRERQLERGEVPTPIIALSASADAGSRERCLAVGMEAFAAKPIEARELVSLVCHHTRPPVVLVDDDEDLRTVVHRFLSRAGYRTEVHASAREFTASTLSPRSLVLVDMQLGARNGLELVAALRAADHRGPIVVLTGEDPGEARPLALGAGAMDLWQKPLSRQELLSRVATITAGRCAQGSRSTPERCILRGSLSAGRTS